MFLEMFFGFVFIFSLLVIGFKMATNDKRKTIKRLKKIGCTTEQIVSYLESE
jgi:hypothetical protein